MTNRFIIVSKSCLFAVVRGAWKLINAGPSWSAEVLDANPSGALASILAGQRPDLDQWKWEPDASFRRFSGQAGGSVTARRC